MLEWRPTPRPRRLVAGSLDVRDGHGVGAGAHRVLDVIDHLQSDPALARQRVGEAAMGPVAGSNYRSLPSAGPNHRLQPGAGRSDAGMVAGVGLDQLEGRFRPEVGDLEGAPYLVRCDLFALVSVMPWITFMNSIWRRRGRSRW